MTKLSELKVHLLAFSGAFKHISVNSQGKIIDDIHMTDQRDKSYGMSLKAQEKANKRILSYVSYGHTNSK